MPQVPNFFNDFSRVLTDIEKGEFYGSLEFKFEKGRVVLCRKTETIKPATGTTGEARLMSPSASQNTV